MNEKHRNVAEFKEHYLSTFDRIIEEKGGEVVDEDITNYVCDLKQHFLTLVSTFNHENFWDIYPKILGIDAKMQLVLSFVFKFEIEDLSGKEIIDIIQTDYKSYYHQVMEFELIDEYGDSLINLIE